VLAQTDVAVVKFPAGNNNEIADFGVMGVYAVHADIADFSVHDQLTVVRHHRGGRDDLSAHRIPDRLHIRQIDEVGLNFRVILSGGFIVGPNQIRADSADLIENQVAARERNRDNQNDRGVSYD
jgi:hypothetical protein